MNSSFEEWNGLNALEILCGTKNLNTNTPRCRPDADAEIFVSLTFSKPEAGTVPAALRLRHRDIQAIRKRLLSCISLATNCAIDDKRK